MSNINKTVKNAIFNYRLAIKNVKEETIAFINSIETPEVNRIGNSSAFSVFLSDVSANKGILSPFFYDTDKQKETLIEIVKNSKQLEFINVFKEIAETGKRLVRTKSSSYHQVYSPMIVNQLKEFIKEEEDHE